MEATHSEQLNRYQRKMNGIRAFKVLDKTDTEIIIRLPQEFGENRTTKIPISSEALSACEIGVYVDVTLSFTVCSGQISSSFMMKFWVVTPSEFIPTHGEDIG